MKLRQRLDGNHKPFSCLFCVGSDRRIEPWVLFGIEVYAGLYMQQYTIHIHFQALLLSTQVQEQGKSEKEIAFCTNLGEESKQGK